MTRIEALEAVAAQAREYVRASLACEYDDAFINLQAGLNELAATEAAGAVADDEIDTYVAFERLIRAGHSEIEARKLVIELFPIDFQIGNSGAHPKGDCDE